MKEYIQKLRGTSKSPPAVSQKEVFLSGLGGFLGIGAVALIHYSFFDKSDFMMIMGSFGSSAVLLYGAPKSPLAQPRNLVGGHVLAATVGVLAYTLFTGLPVFAAAIGAAASIVIMHVTRTLHPPAGATALTYIIGGESIHKLGFLFVLIPTLAGALVMLLVALIFNNIPKTRKYPEFWY
jgi:CBS-domain-containing membrane protein